jgi:hypothetical protein
MTPAGPNDQPPLLTAPSKSFTVGTCRCAFPSPVVFYSDRCQYTFHHPFAKTEVAMVMYFRDMRSVILNKPVSAVGDMKFVSARGCKEGARKEGGRANTQ